MCSVWLLQADMKRDPARRKAGLLTRKGLLDEDGGMTYTSTMQDRKGFRKESDGTGKEKLILAEVKIRFAYLINHLKSFLLQHILTHTHLDYLFPFFFET